ncbi:MAG: DUF423 domain-containing protein [Bacteroidota bacterium]
MHKYKFGYISGGIFAALAVGLGAFGAHGLESLLAANGRTATYETAVQYHFYHALALLIVAIVIKRHDHKFIRWTSYLFAAGIIIFSGSLYILSLTNITILGAITPIGGVCFILGWLFFVVGIAKGK